VLIWRYRHPLGSLRPFVARFRLTYYDGWSAPAPLGFVQGALALLTGERIRVGDRRPRFMCALWSGRGCVIVLSYAATVATSFREETFYG